MNQSQDYYRDRYVTKTPAFAHYPEMSFLEKKMAKNEKPSVTWLQVSKFAYEQDYQKAYELALVQTDDIYLLRLIFQTGPVISRGLTDYTAKRVL